MFLVTTADEHTWKKDERILFLGEWCKLYARKNIWSKLNYEVMPYHWDDRDRYYSDYKYLSAVYEKNLHTLSIHLNTIHRSDHSLRYWRIVIGPWLRYFIDSIFDRYCSIKSAIDNNQVSLTWILESDSKRWIPNDFLQFYQEYTSDEWNHMIYGEIVKLIGGIPYKIIKRPFQQREPHSRAIKLPLKYKIKKYINNIYSFLIPDKLNGIVFISSYFTRRSDLFKLQINLRQLPYPLGPTIKSIKVETDMNRRRQLKNNTHSNEFEYVLNEIMQFQIPKTYVEGYKNLNCLVSKKYPKRIKGIFTANAYSHDDGFKIWTAGRVEKGVKLFIHQHGGNMGAALWSQSEDHQLTISDRYYSWGWFREGYSNITPIPASKLINIKNAISPDHNGNILSILGSFPRYFYYSFSMPTSGQSLNYYVQQISLIRLLDPNVLEMFKIRLDSPDFGWNLKDRFFDLGYGKYIETNKAKLLDRLNGCRLCLVTVNATVFLETFSANYPTILYWNPDHFEIRESAKKYYDELERVGILHYSPESAALLLNKIYDDPAEWWNQDEIQEAKDNFCETFAYNSENWLVEWKNELKQLSN